MSRNTIRLDVERLIKQTGSTDPFEIFDYMNVIVQYDELDQILLMLGKVTNMKQMCLWLNY